MATENFTTYTEVDPNSKIAKTATRITFTNLKVKEDAYVYKDFGVDYFSGDFTAEFEIWVTGTPSAGPITMYFSLANLVDDAYGIVTANSDALWIEVRVISNPPPLIRLGVIEVKAGALTRSAEYGLTVNTSYYLKVVRDESVGTHGILYCYVYSDPARINLLKTLAKTLGVKTDFRYLYALQSWNVAQNYGMSGWMEDLELFVFKSTTAPSVTTQAVTDIDKTTATGNGNVTSLGAPPATQHGHCWATHTKPSTVEPTTHTVDGGRTENGVPSATGAFTSNLTTLRPNTKYYARTYITNSVGTIYGAEVEFTTLSDVPVVTTDLATKVACSTAQGNGSIDNNGGSAITEHGVCWGTSANPTTSDSKTEEGAYNVIGDFSSLMTGLTPETTYHYRAYAVNATGTGYGADVIFTTHAIGAPIVTTQRSTNVQAESATGNGTIVDTGGAAVTEHGHCWGTSANPTTSDSKTEKGAGEVGAFTSGITGLTAGTPYYIRAYATNSYGTSYGDNDIINQLAGELKGEIAVLSEWLVYTSKTGVQRALLGDEF